MDISYLKNYILDNDLIPIILEGLGCHHIKKRDGFYQSANPDGDNVTAVCVYENEFLTTVNYTRNISPKSNQSSDIISLVEFYHQESFPFAIKWICTTIGLDYYAETVDELPESLKLTQLLLGMQTNDELEEDNKKLIPISEHILSYYYPFVNDLFAKDGISYSTQKEFEIGYDDTCNRITIPIRDDIGNLVGVKGRYFSEQPNQNVMKYLYIENCARSQILYGLNKTINYIKHNNRVFVTEAEKGVMQLWENDYFEGVGIGGKKISKCQIEKLTRLCVPIIFVFDKDVDESELNDIANRFAQGVDVYAMIDRNNILDEKQSPTDDIDKFKVLLKHNVYKLH